MKGPWANRKITPCKTANESDERLVKRKMSSLGFTTTKRSWEESSHFRNFCQEFLFILLTCFERCWWYYAWKLIPSQPTSLGMKRENMNLLLYYTARNFVGCCSAWKLQTIWKVCLENNFPLFESSGFHNKIGNSIFLLQHLQRNSFLLLGFNFLIYYVFAFNSSEIQSSLRDF